MDGIENRKSFKEVISKIITCTSLPLQNAQDKKCRMGEHTLITKETQTKEEISSRHSLLPLTEGFSCDFRAGGKEKSAKLREKAEKQILRDGRYNF